MTSKYAGSMPWMNTIDPLPLRNVIIELQQ